MTCWTLTLSIWEDEFSQFCLNLLIVQKINTHVDFWFYSYVTQYSEHIETERKITGLLKYKLATIKLKK